MMQEGASSLLVVGVARCFALSCPDVFVLSSRQEAPGIREKMGQAMKTADHLGRSLTADWNAVNTGGAEFVLAKDEAGSVIPNRILKIQAAALVFLLQLRLLLFHSCLCCFFCCCLVNFGIYFEP